MSLSTNKILLANATANTVGALIQPVSVASVGAGNATAMLNSKVIPTGTYMVPATANVTIEINAYTGTANSWTTYLANNTSGVIISDGFNVRANAVTGTQTVTLYGFNEGTAVSGTFLS
ncbi:MAG: hypothetical protein EBR82_12035 [Caulobacteraceae bacterium]|nr:hypothetical protein [Caulobacteraceae bacterium]